MVASGWVVGLAIGWYVGKVNAASIGWSIAGITGAIGGWVMFWQISRARESLR